MVSSTRLLLQCNQLQELIKEQNRLALLELEPSEQEREDLSSLLDLIHSGLARLDGVEAREVRKEFEARLDELEEIDIDSQKYRAPFIPDISEGTLDQEPQPALASAAKSSLSQLNSSDAVSVKKTVRFSDTHEESFREPYRDDPQEQSAAQLYDLNEELMLDQDRRLDQLSHSVRRQHTMGVEIDEEVTDQISYLDDLEAQTDRSQGRLDSARHRVENFNRSAREYGACWTIFLLTVILILLIVIL